MLIASKLELRFENGAYGWIAERQELLLSSFGPNLDNVKGKRQAPKDRHYYGRIEKTYEAHFS